ncbi:MAG: dihydropteroate synthase [Candidatus Hydrothermales bacterium]
MIFSFKEGFINLDKPKIMGILNVTPDSFFDGGKFLDVDKAVEWGKYLSKNGADILDIGGESTRPFSEEVPIEIELKRVIPVIEKLRKEIDVPISIDTRKSKVALEALKKGANIVNDISGLRDDKEMVEVVKKFDAGIVIMHIRGTPKDMQIDPHYKDTVKEIKEELKEKINYALEKGIKREKIVIDPGIGFGKRVVDNLLILKKIEEFKELNFPILVGHSRKSFIGKVLNLDKPEDRGIPTLAISAYLFLKNINILRVHDVKETKEVFIILDALLNPDGH